MELGLEIEEQSLDGARFRDKVIKMELGLGIEFKDQMELGSGIEL